MKKWIRRLLCLAACLVLVGSGGKLAAYLLESRASSQVQKTLLKEAVEVRSACSKTEENTEEAADSTASTVPPLTVDFAALRKTCSDVVGWLYSEDTPINLPVVQAEDNAYYLRRLPDGTDNNGGTLFLDYRSAGDFSDVSMAIYGHNMENRSMFGTLCEYQSQEYYEAHPILWLFTPQCTWQVELLVGCVIDAADPLYSLSQGEDEMLQLVESMQRQSTFLAKAQPQAGDRFLVLSTCSYEFETARYVLVGRLKAVEE